MFGEIAQAIRKKAGLTQEGLAVRWGKSRVQVGRYERSGELPPLVADAYAGLEALFSRKESAMKTMIFPGVHGIPSKARVGVVFPEDSSFGHEVTVVMHQSSSSNDGTLLFNTDDGRDVLLNRVMENELRGVRNDFIRLVVIVEGGGGLNALELPIRLDINDYCARGNPHEVNVAKGLKGLITGKKDGVAIYSIHVTAGCAKVYTKFDERIPVDETRARDLLSRAML